MPKGSRYDLKTWKFSRKFPVTSKKMLLVFFFLDVLFYFFSSFFKKFTFSKPSESSRWGREVMWLDFPLSALELGA